MFQRPACLQGRRSRNGSDDDFSTFPIRQLFVLGKLWYFCSANYEKQNQEKDMVVARCVANHVYTIYE